MISSFTHLIFLIFFAFLDPSNLLPTKDKPLIVDDKRKMVLIYTEVNLKQLHKNNPHWGVVFKDGKLSNKAILKSYCSHLEFYKALISIGAKAGNNLTKESIGRYVEGDELLVFALIDGKEYSLEKVFKDSSGKGFKIKFGGNLKSAEEQNTGCIMCLESCWVAITSNANYPNISNLQRFFNPNSKFKANEEILPSIEGYPVILIYKLK